MNNFVKIGDREGSNVVKFGIKENRRQKTTPKQQWSSNESAAGEESPTGSGGGGGMNDILRRIESLEQGQKDLKDDLKDKVSKSDLDKSTLELKLYMRELFEKVPTEDRIKTIFSEQLKSHGVATETYVKAQINESNATLMKWIVGIGISAIVSIGLALIRFFTH